MFFSFHLRATLKVKSEPSFGEGKDSGEGAQLQPVAPVSMANNPSMDVAHLSSSGRYSSPPPSLLAWKQLTGSIPQMPASMPNLPSSSPLATTSLENAKPQVKPGFLQFQEKYVETSGFRTQRPAFLLTFHKLIKRYLLCFFPPHAVIHVWLLTVNTPISSTSTACLEIASMCARPLERQNPIAWTTSTRTTTWSTSATSFPTTLFSVSVPTRWVWLDNSARSWITYCHLPEVSKHEVCYLLDQYLRLFDSRLSQPLLAVFHLCWERQSTHPSNACLYVNDVILTAAFSSQKRPI